MGHRLQAWKIAALGIRPGSLITTLLVLYSLHIEDTEAVSVLALYLLYPWLNVVRPRFLVNFFARVYKDQKAIGSGDIAFDGGGLVVTARYQFSAARLDCVVDLVNATGFVAIGNVDPGHFLVGCVALGVKWLTAVAPSANVAVASKADCSLVVASSHEREKRVTRPLRAHAGNDCLSSLNV
jgi:hypothetical protein